MRIVTPQQLCQAYRTLNPGEISHAAEGVRILGNWLQRYLAHPDQAIAADGNWHGKVTAALFHALGLKLPRTKRERLVVLDRRDSAAHILHTQPTGVVHDRAKGWFAQCSACTWSYAPMDQDLVGLARAVEIHSVHLTQLHLMEGR